MGGISTQPPPLCARLPGRGRGNFRAQSFITESTKNKDLLRKKWTQTEVPPVLRLDMISNILVSKSGKSIKTESRFVVFYCDWGGRGENGSDY